MQLAFQIAKRYLWSKKSTNAVNVIAAVSVVGMMVGTLALLLVLSVFNGFEEVVASLYNTFNADLKVETVKGKTFEPDSLQLVALKEIEGVEAFSLVLEENAFLKYKEQNSIVRLKGVDDQFIHVSAVDSAIAEGEFLLEHGPINYAVLGIVVQHKLGINLSNEFTPIKIHMPKRDAKINRSHPERDFQIQDVYPAASFFIQQDFDSKYAFVPLRLMRKLLNHPKAVSAIEIAISPNANPDVVQQKIQALFGDSKTVKNRYQQDESVYQVMQAEKWVVYLILSFILVVASFNIIGSLSMLVIEKRLDIGILKAMGGTKQLIRQIFFLEGVLLSLVGAFTGGLLAVIICLIQQHFKIIRLQGVSFLIDAYPVQMQLWDFILVFMTVVVISVLAAVVPARMAAAQSQLLKEE